MGKVAREVLRARATDLFRAHAILEGAAIEERDQLGANGWSESLLRVAAWLKREGVKLDAQANEDDASQASDQRAVAGGDKRVEASAGSGGRQTVLPEDDGA